MNTAWHRVVYPSHVKQGDYIIALAVGEYRKLEDKKDFCVFMSSLPVTFYFSPKASEIFSYTLRSLADSEDIEVTECDRPTGDWSLELIAGIDPECQSLLNRRNDDPRIA